VLPDQIRPLAVPRGQKVLSRKRMGPLFFRGGSRKFRGEEVLVGFDDGGEEWTRIAALRFHASGPRRHAGKVASHAAVSPAPAAGDRVWRPGKAIPCLPAPWTKSRTRRSTHPFRRRQFRLGCCWSN